MSGLDMLANNKRSRSFAPYTPTGFGEIAGTRLIDLAYKSPDSIANIPANFLAKNEIQKRDELIKKRFGVDDLYSLIDVSDIEKQSSFLSPVELISVNKEKRQRLENYIQEQKKARPDLWEGIKTKEEIDQPMIGRAREASRIADEKASRAESGFASVGGTLAGGFGGAMTGIINLATLPLGFGAGRGILQTMAMEGVLNASIEAVQVPMRKEWMDTLGFKYGLKEAAADVAFAGIGGAALTGVIRGGSKAARAIKDRGSKGLEILSRMSDDASIPKEGRDALKYQSRVAHIDEEIPISGATKEDVAVHRSNVAETERAIQENREPVYAEFDGVEKSEQLYYVPPELEDQWAQAVSIKEAFEKKDYVENIKEKTLIDWIKKRGGVNDPTGELRSYLKVGGRGNAYVGLVTKKIGQKYAPDNVVREAAQAGFFQKENNNKPSDLTSADLFEEIDRELRGLGRSRRETNSLHDSLRAQGFDDNMTVIEIYEAIIKDREGIDVKSEEVDVFSEYYPDYLLEAFPNNTGGFEAMRATVEAAEETAPTFEADFARLLKDNPDMKLDMDGESVSLKDVAARIKEDANIIKAMKVCAIG